MKLPPHRQFVKIDNFPARFLNPKGICVKGRPAPSLRCLLERSGARPCGWTASQAEAVLRALVRPDTWARARAALCWLLLRVYFGKPRRRRHLAPRARNEAKRRRGNRRPEALRPEAIARGTLGPRGDRRGVAPPGEGGQPLARPVTRAPRGAGRAPCRRVAFNTTPGAARASRLQEVA